MRLWSIHPKHLDSVGLVAVWREGLLAQAVLRGRTRGYRTHPQLRRFQRSARPLATMATYLSEVHREATRRGYSFNAARIGPLRTTRKLTVTGGQLGFEWAHLKRKLRNRAPAVYRDLLRAGKPEPHPLFRVVSGPVSDWELGGRSRPKAETRVDRPGLRRDRRCADSRFDPRATSDGSTARRDPDWGELPGSRRL